MAEQRQLCMHYIIISTVQKYTIDLCCSALISTQCVGSVVQFCLRSASV